MSDNPKFYLNKFSILMNFFAFAETNRWPTKIVLLGQNIANISHKGFLLWSIGRKLF